MAAERKMLGALKKFEGNIRRHRPEVRKRLVEYAKAEFRPLLEGLGSMEYDEVERLSGNDGIFSDERQIERALFSLLRHREKRVVAAAGEVLGSLVDGSHKWELIGLTMHESPATAARASALLGKIDDDSIVPTLFAIFEETGDCHMLNAIGGTGIPSAVAKLGEYADSEDFFLRMQAMQTLVELRNPAARKYFIRALDHQDFVAVGQAAAGLGFLGDFSAVPALIEAFEKRNARLPKITHSRSRTQTMTFGIDGNYGINYMEMKIPQQAIGNPVDKIAQALGKIGDKRAVPALLEAAKTTPHELVRSACVRALARIGGVENSFFIEMLGPRFSESVRSSSAVALEKTECVPDLYKAYLESDRPVRTAIIKIMGRIVAGIGKLDKIQEFLVHWDIALEKSRNANIAEDLTGDEISSMADGVYSTAKAKERLMASMGRG